MGKCVLNKNLPRKTFFRHTAYEKYIPHHQTFHELQNNKITNALIAMQLTIKFSLENCMCGLGEKYTEPEAWHSEFAALYFALVRRQSVSEVPKSELANYCSVSQAALVVFSVLASLPAELHS